MLAASYLFRNLPRERLSDCAARIRWQRIPRGTYICRVGDPANAIFILAFGAIRGSRFGPDGEEFVDMVVSGPGDLLGTRASCHSATRGLSSVGVSGGVLE